MGNLSKKDFILVSLMLFSLFFGAGNLIFPPFLGQSAGHQMWIAMLGFFVTAVGFPVLGVIAVAKSKGLYNLAARVNPVFASIFTVLIYLSIGPGLGIPRAGSLPFEMAVAPYLSAGFSIVLARFLFTALFFACSYWLALSPAKLVDRMGKVLTPTLLALIILIFVGSIIKPIGDYGMPTHDYQMLPFVKGFLEGYLTMDTIAALNFGIVIALAIRTKGVTDEKLVIQSTIKSGLVAGALLIFIYLILGHLGAMSGAVHGQTENGAQTLTYVMNDIFGTPGAILLAIVFTLACLTTCVGLITSCGQYFASLTPKISYNVWASILALCSMTLANMGLNQILAISVPVLDAIYPVAIVLIVLSMLNRFTNESFLVYRVTILVTGMVSVIYAFDQIGVRLGLLTTMCKKLPLYRVGLGWVILVLGSLLVTIILDRVLDLSNSSESLASVNYIEE